MTPESTPVPISLEPTPLSPAQNGIWFNEQLGGTGAVYHMPFSVSFDGDLDAEALTDACRAVAERHPVLVSAVAERDGTPHLVPAREVPPMPAIVEIDEDAGKLAAALDREILRPFDLRRGPLGRWTLFRLGPRRHVLLVVVHHLAFDGQSTDIYVRDLAALYSGRALPALPPEEETPLPVAEAREFWARNAFAQPPDVLLPGLSGPVPQVDEGGSVEFSLPSELRKRIAVAAEDMEVSRFELLLGSLHALLFRYGNAGPVIAVDLGTRNASARDRIGVHVNEVPIGTRPAAETTFRSFARELRRDLRAMYPYRAVPLARVVGGLRPAVGLAPVTLTYRRREPAPEFAGVSASVDWVIFNHTARNALRIHLVEGPDDLGVILQYGTGSLDRDSVERVRRHWLTLLEAATAHPDTPLAELPLLGEAERRAVCGKAVNYGDATVASLFAAQAAATPDAEALVFGAERLTYRELAAAVTSAAGGITPGTLVPIRSRRSVEMVVTMLAALAAGAAYLPIDPEHPADRQAFILEDAQRPAEPSDRDGLAYVIYTSGSTGRPKGVEVTGPALVNLLLAMRDELGIGPHTAGGTTWLAHTSVSFDIANLEILLPLITGGRVVVAEDARDPQELLRLIRAHPVTHVQATPSGWRMLLDAGFDERAVHALTGGEALPLPLARELRARTGRLWNVYGPTETTIWSTIWEVPEEPAHVSIGRPIANTEIRVLDERLQPVPAGLPGELHIGGGGLARGYRGRPELTAERFVRDPESGARLYRTGDRARWLPDGTVEFLGRMDDQVKIRGHRIEPGEIEARLMAHPRVSQAAVTVLDGDRLVAYVSPEAAPDLREHLAKWLPPIMIPAAFVALDRLPLTPNGKLDRRSLPKPPPSSGRPYGEDPYREKETPDELRELVTAIWREVLKRDDFGPDDSLFDLGGHSLTITQIASRVRRRLQVHLPLHVYYDNPTLAGLVEAIRPAHEGRERGEGGGT
ncbi:amino acid adenylation domain-containing protein [Planotetraspora sp. A-T 1434]|uniref:non-ribosomal peptide synthetase n=1 Tax=Planotetraspora sp. A-T 1434 TaxID=2979219 RepID=UPI0021C01432|nr:amino acid adenylation domain-containing protein [Planotetraspora sp. A-T 1434]MCT9930235.1 amino acid adenylation domain-containing protein [Planotetraspora sp. A-T 1434]